MDTIYIVFEDGSKKVLGDTNAKNYLLEVKRRACTEWVELRVEVTDEQQ